MFAKHLFAVSFVGSALLLSPGAALAKGQTVLVTGFTGAKKQKLRSDVVRALEAAGYETVDDEKLTDASNEKDIAKHAKAKKADAVVTGDAIQKKSGWKLKLVVRSAKDGAVVEETELTAPMLPKLESRIEAGTASSLAGPIDRAAEAAEPPAEEPKPQEEEAKKEEKEEPEEEARPADKESEADREPPRRARPSPLDFGTGFRVFRRELRWSQDVNQNLRKYALPVSPAAFARVAWYPAAHFTSGFASNLGITGGYEQSFASTSELETGGGSYTTTMRAWSVGARLRLPFSSHEGGFGLRYGAQSFTVDGDRDPGAQAPIGGAVTRDYVPDVSYKHVRPSADLRLGFGPVTLGASVGMRFITDMGALQSSEWFPDATGLGIDGEIMGGYAVAKDFFVVLGFAIQRYGLDMHSKPSDLDQRRDVAGGAVDQYLSVHTGIEWRPGSSRPSADVGSKGRVHVGQR